MAIVAAVGAPSEFANGRHFATYFELVPRKHSSGARFQLMALPSQLQLSGHC